MDLAPKWLNSEPKMDVRIAGPATIIQEDQMDNGGSKTTCDKSKPRILVVDDQPTVALVVQAVLVHSGFCVETAANGRKALDLLMGGVHFDLVITDVRMPEMDGFELLRKIRKWREDLPVIIMTAHANHTNRLQAIQEGAFDYVLKPFAVGTLLNTVHRALKDK